MANPPEKIDALKSMTEEEFADYKGMSEEELQEMFKEMERARRACEGLGVPTYIPDILIRW